MNKESNPSIILISIDDFILLPQNQKIKEDQVNKEEGLKRKIREDESRTMLENGLIMRKREMEKMEMEKKAKGTKVEGKRMCKEEK